MICPNCHLEIEKENINVQTDVAHCVHCNNIFKLSNVIKLLENEFNIFDHPPGTWIKNEFNSITIGAIHRSPQAIIMFPFIIIWFSLFIWQFYINQLLNAELNLINSLFGLPFITFASFFISMALIGIWGKVEITLNINGGSVFTGIGFLSITKEFKWNDIKSIKEVASYRRDLGNRGKRIRLEGKSNISFGSQINEKRLSYILNSLNKIHSNIKILGRLI